MLRSMVAVALCLFSLSSCFELEAEFELRADGSGRQRLRLGLNDRLLHRLELSAQAMGAVGNPTAIFDEAAAGAMLEQQGLAVASHRRFRQRRREFVELIVDLPKGALGKGGLFGAEGESYLLKGRVEGGARLVIYPRGFAAWSEAQKKIDALEQGLTHTQSEWFAQQRRRMRGVSGSFSISLPGAVRYCSTNLEKGDAGKVVGKIGDGDLRKPADLLRVMAPRFEVEFDARGLDLSFDRGEPLQQAANER